MNKRIQELAEQATTYIKPTENSGEGWIFDKEKFTDLIIRECICQCDDENSQKYIMTHFGMKESDWS